MAKRQVFYSFEYNKDNWRASQVRNMGKCSDDSTLSDNDWEEVKMKSDDAIEKWICDQMRMRSCIVVLIGSTTYNRKWVKYEIKKAYELNKGIVGIYIHGLEDRDGKQSEKGKNPFDYVYAKDGKALSNYVTAFNSNYSYSKNVYGDIKDCIEELVESAIEKSGTF